MQVAQLPLFLIALLVALAVFAGAEYVPGPDFVDQVDEMMQTGRPPRFG